MSSHKLTEKSGVSKTYAKWSKSETSNDITKRIEVEEVENGYVITTEVYGNTGKNKEWKSETKKMISKTNPLEKESPVDNDDPLEQLKELFA
jgi:hypothetical protein